MTPRYSRVRCISVSSYGRYELMLMLKTYLDDSGKSDDPCEQMCCIAGCVSPIQAWEDFEPEWKAVLAKFEVPYLHMREYAHSEGPFKKWRGNEAVRKDFLAALMDIMDRHVLSVIGTTIPINAFKRLTGDQKRAVRDPYFMCLQQTLHAAGSIAFAETAVPQHLGLVNPHDAEKIQVIFSRQDDFKSQADSLYEYMQRHATIGPMLGAFTWDSYKNAVPLQAADLVAYEMRGFAADLSTDGPTMVRVPMKRLFGMNPLVTFFNYNDIVKRFHFSGPAFRS
jgi:hypothetical protein